MTNSDSSMEDGEFLFNRLKNRNQHKKAMIERADRSNRARGERRRNFLVSLTEGVFSGSISSLEVDLDDDPNEDPKEYCFDSDEESSSSSSDEEEEDIAISRFQSSPATKRKTKDQLGARRSMSLDSAPELPKSYWEWDQQNDDKPTNMRPIHKQRRFSEDNNLLLHRVSPLTDEKKNYWRWEESGLAPAELKEFPDLAEARWNSNSSHGNQKDSCGDLADTLGRVALVHRHSVCGDRHLIPPRKTVEKVDFEPASLPKNWSTSRGTDKRWHGKSEKSDAMLVSPMRCRK